MNMLTSSSLVNIEMALLYFPKYNNQINSVIKKLIYVPLTREFAAKCMDSPSQNLYTGIIFHMYVEHCDNTR